MALMESICELVDTKSITESAGYDVLRQFDYSITKVSSIINEKWDIMPRLQECCKVFFIPLSFVLPLFCAARHLNCLC